MEQEFGRDALSDHVKASLENDPDRKFEVLHLVEPRPERNRRSASNQDMPWRSVYLELGGGGGFCARAGIRSFPIW